MGNAVSTLNHIDRAGPEYQRLFPPILQTQNKHLHKEGPLALYESAFIISFQGLFLQLLFWGIYSGLVGFSMKRMMDLHYLSVTFAMTFLLLTIHFLSDLELNTSKLLFFSQHVGIEFLIAIRVLMPPSIVRQWTGLIFFVVWLLVVGSTCVIVSNHAVYFAIGMASLSDILISVSGLVLMVRKLRQRHASQLAGHKLTVEAISGLGYLIHGLSALSNTVAVVLLLKTQDPPSHFGITWTSIAMAGLLAVGLQLPVAGMYFDNISCCITRRRKTFQGDIDWEDTMDQEEMVLIKRQADFKRVDSSKSSGPPLDIHAIYHIPHRDLSSHAY
ncbi:hypothetical protein Ptr86124_004149 [Pyrenophora tritici-repentis]|uniref:Uncharacterized protein n=1 Tax=Pyrenophora tritici-repentis TaxID=45151 RepID=A0A922T2I7_9PLEO|nr:hypothetical protein Ptr86124_004149 [Pyrenophora tritici-repentis]